MVYENISRNTRFQKDCCTKTDISVLERDIRNTSTMQLAKGLVYVKKHVVASERKESLIKTSHCRIYLFISL